MYWCGERVPAGKRRTPALDGISIIINEPQESYRFDFLLESSSLTAVLNENSSVSFLNSDQEEIYRIPIAMATAIP